MSPIGPDANMSEHTDYFLEADATRPAQGQTQCGTNLSLSWPSRRWGTPEARFVAELLFALSDPCPTIAFCRNIDHRRREFDTAVSADCSIVLPAPPHHRAHGWRMAPVYTVPVLRSDRLAAVMEEYWRVYDGSWIFMDWPMDGAHHARRISLLEFDWKRTVDMLNASAVACPLVGVTYDDWMLDMKLHAGADQVGPVLNAVARRCSVTLRPERA